MPSYRTEQIRNVVLLSHGGAGKTSLTEAMLFNAGHISRLGRVEDGSTTSDWDPDEQKRRISTATSVLPVEWQGHKLNILDAPGYADFVGEMKSAARVADLALILVDGAGGVEVGTELVWGYAGDAHLPRMLVVNRLDRENSDFQRVLDQLRQVFGHKVVALQAPVGAHHGFSGVVDLLERTAYLGAEGTAGPVPPELEDTVERLREQLVEAVAEVDDALVAKYLDSEELTLDELRAALRKAVAQQAVYPVLCAAGGPNLGIRRLLDTLVTAAPSPIDLPNVVPCDPAGPLAAFVFKSMADPFVGKLNYFRVYSGTLHSDAHVLDVSKDKPERVSQVLFVRGKHQEPTPEVVAGDIGAVAKMADCSTGDTLTTKEHPITLPAIDFPRPVYSVAVHPRSKADLDKLGTSLARLVEEDPSLHVHRDPDTAETILGGLGESHVEIAVEKMKRKFGVDVTTSLPRVSYKETITVSTKSEYKHKKQTGGHGQYGHVFLELEPQPRGQGFSFGEKVVGGTVPRNFFGAVEKGVHTALSEGAVAHFPLVDLRVMLYDGSYHPVDSSDMAFQIAASQAVKQGVLKAHPVLLEPVMDLTVTVPEAMTGDTISDLNTKRAKVHSMLPDGERTTITASVPLAEVQHYAADLRSVTQGRGAFTIEFSHYEEVPAQTAQRVIEHARREREHVEKAS